MFFSLTTDQILVFQVDGSLKLGYYFGEEGESMPCENATFWCKLTPGMFLIFHRTYSLQNHLWNVVRNLYNLEYTHWKTSEPCAEQ